MRKWAEMGVINFSAYSQFTISKVKLQIKFVILRVLVALGKAS